jgi:hypothetical protein
MPDRRRDPSPELLAGEVAGLRERVATLEESNKWIVSTLKSLDKKVWMILSGIIVSILLTLFSLVH